MSPCNLYKVVLLCSTFFLSSALVPSKTLVVKPVRKPIELVTVHKTCAASGRTLIALSAGESEEVSAGKIGKLIFILAPFIFVAWDYISHH